jgi:hypothetical protein
VVGTRKHLRAGRAGEHLEEVHGVDPRARQQLAQRAAPRKRQQGLGAARPGEQRPEERRPLLRQGLLSDCHFAVHLNYFIPGFLSYSVAVYLK